MDDLSTLLPCPHGESREEYPIRELLDHLEQCPSPCRDEGGHSGDDNASDGAKNGKGCGHLQRYDVNVTDFLAEKKCPHDACDEEVPNPRMLPRHLEQCQDSCDLPENGHCSHLSSVDAILAAVLDSPELFCREKDEEMNVTAETPKTQAAKSSTVENPPLDSPGNLFCPHSECEEPGFGVAEEFLRHLRACEKPCSDSMDGCKHVTGAGLSDFAAGNFSKSSPSDMEQDEVTKGGQPPVFNPPPNLSKDEVSKLRRDHLQMVKKLSAEEKRHRQIMRNRRSARLSKERRQRQIDQLISENKLLRRALNQVVNRLAAVHGSPDVWKQWERT